MKYGSADSRTRSEPCARESAARAIPHPKLALFGIITAHAMTYAIVSDIHANPDALERVLADAASLGADKVACLGDIVGYGPLPAEALAKVRSAAAIVVAGNHDDAVSGRMDAKDFIGLAADAVSWHRAALSKDDIAYLKSLPYTARIDGALLAHGDATAPESFLYVDSENSAAENFAATDEQIIFVGHTHVPCIHLVGASGAVYRLEPRDFEAEEGKRYIVNVGSVGYPRESDGKCFSTYVLHDTEERTVQFRSIPFRVESLLPRKAAAAKTKARWIGAAAAALVAAGVAGAIVSSRQSRTSKPMQTAPQVAAETQTPRQASAAVVEKTLALPFDCQGVRANLALSKGSAPALLRISFADADGRELSPAAQTVRQSSSKAFPVPAGAVRAKVSVMRASEGGPAPDIRVFSPSAK